MIHGDKSSSASIRGMMRQSKIEFHLTGSRYFGNAKPTSDWDFFTENDQDTVQWLRDAGFRCIKENHQYKDCQVVSVWRYGGVPITEQEGEVFSFTSQIDVQIVTASYLKMKAQAYIFSNPWLLERHNKSHKTERSVLWDLVYAAMYGLKYEGYLNIHYHGTNTNRPNTVDLEQVLSEF